MLPARRNVRVIGSLWVTLVAAVGLVLGLVVAPTAAASGAGASEASAATADASAGGASHAASGGGAGVDPVAYINAQSTGIVTQVSAGREYTCAVTTAGAAYCWGSNTDGQLGDGEGGDSGDKSETPVRVKAGAQGGDGFLSSVSQISAGSFHTCAVTDETGANAYCWGFNADGQLGNGEGGDSGDKSKRPVRVKAGAQGGDGFLSNVSQISAGANYTCAVTDADAAFCWGRNNYGQLGDGEGGDFGDQSGTPVQVKGVGGTGVLSNVSQISVGFAHTCAVTDAGSAFCWGRNNYGQLGNDTTDKSAVPVQVVTGKQQDPSGLLSDVSQISAGAEYTCAVTGDEAAFCWGDNFYGQLGNGEGGDVDDKSETPVQVKGVGGTGVLSSVSQISAGAFHMCALTGVTGTGGSAFCWGQNGEGRLGNGQSGDNSPDQCGSNGCSKVPVEVVNGGEGFVNGEVMQISAGAEHTCAVTAAGAVYCWGSNDKGQLGNGKFGSNHNSSVPVAVAGQLSIVPNPVVFGTVDVESSKSKDVVVKHSFPLTARAVVVDVGIISKPVGFSFDPRSGCTNDQEGRVLTLTDDTECTGVVKFAPKTPGEHGGIVSLTPRDYPNAGTQLSASGFAPPGANPDGAVVKASSGDFGKVDVFTAKVKNIKITNVGDEPLRITGAKIKADADDEFTASVKDCTQDPVAPGKSCTAKVQFFPRDAGETAALLDLKSNAIGGDTIALAGEGVIPVQETDAPGKVRKLRVPDKTVTAKKATAKWKRPRGRCL